MLSVSGRGCGAGGGAASVGPGVDRDLAGPDLARGLADFDAVATNESAVPETCDDVLAAIMRGDVRTDRTVREDVRAKLASSIKRLLILYNCWLRVTRVRMIMTTRLVQPWNWIRHDRGSGCSGQRRRTVCSSPTGS